MLELQILYNGEIILASRQSHPLPIMFVLVNHHKLMMRRKEASWAIETAARIFNSGGGGARLRQLEQHR